VYLVKKVNSGVLYAMKVLWKERYFKENLIAYAMSERNVLCQLQHPFITQLHYAFQTAERLIFIIELCPGGDLGKLLMRKPCLDERLALMYFCEMILAIEELHNHDIIYRDLKPENVMFDADGHVKITDFGLSKQMPKDDFMTKTFCGTIAYIAPEVLKRNGYTKAIDWYTLGVVMYEMIEGKQPYTSLKREETIENIISGNLKFSKIKNKHLQDLITRVTARQMMHREPSVRLGSRGAYEVKEHPYFLSRFVDWEMVYNKELPVPVPDINRTLKPADVSPERQRVYGTTEGVGDLHVDDWSFFSGSQVRRANMED
jgi:serine/threonine protein kinase